MNLIESYLPSFLLASVLGFAIWGVHWLLIGRHLDMGNERKFPRQLIIFGLSLLSVLAVILALPISEGSRNQLIGIIGLLVSGAIAFSSTSILANLMGGILLRTTKPFRVGDFIRVEQHFGRVTERGLFDTELQTQSRELVALPNSYLISHPITTTPSSGAIVSASLSLGYDIHHGQAERLLLRAAKASELKEPFVHLLEMGNYSVTYRVSGLLEDTKLLITAHSNLCRAILDTLHGAGVEIMSPSYMNQRRLDEEFTAIPKTIEVPATAKTEGGEHITFDKAEEAERKEKEKQQILKVIQELETSLKESAEENKSRIKNDIESARERLKELEEAQAESRSEENRAEQGQGGDGWPASGPTAPHG